MKRLSRFLTQRPKLLRKTVAGVEDELAPALYTLERTTIGVSIDSLTSYNTLDAAVVYICRKARVPRPFLKLVNPTEGAEKRWFGWQTGDTIYLNTGWHGQNMFVLLHELAHFVTFEIYEDDNSIQDHGPEFIGVYRWMLDRLNVLPIVAFDALLDEYMLDFITYHPGDRHA